VAARLGPARLTALSFAIVGDFEDAIYCWRTQAKTWAAEAGGEHAGIVLASGAGALGVLLGGSVPVVGGEPESGPISASTICPRRISAERGRPHLARARAVARADGAAHASRTGRRK
jgi:cobalamin biosynthesis protein CobD/CbiB